MNIDSFTKKEKAELVKQIVKEDRLALIDGFNGLDNFEVAPMLATLIVNGVSSEIQIDRLADIHLLVAGILSKKNKGMDQLGELGSLHDTLDTLTYIISEKSDEPLFMEIINSFADLFKR